MSTVNHGLDRVGATFDDESLVADAGHTRAPTKPGVIHSHAIQVFDLDPDADPPKVLAIGPDTAANLLEIIWLELDDDRDLVIHAMPLRPTFFSLLPDEESQP